MAKVITFSTKFPAYHPKNGQETYFVEQFWNSFNVHVKRLNETFYMPFDILELNEHLPYNLVSEIKKKVEATNRGKIGSKFHTIREGQRFKAGDMFSPRIWSGKPYYSKQIIIAPDTLIEKTWNFKISGGEFKINDKIYGGESEFIYELLEEIAKNDGLNRHDLLEWFKYPKYFTGQIICWNKNINY